MSRRHEWYKKTIFNVADEYLWVQTMRIWAVYTLAVTTHTHICPHAYTHTRTHTHTHTYTHTRAHTHTHTHTHTRHE